MSIIYFGIYDMLKKELEDTKNKKYNLGYLDMMMRVRGFCRKNHSKIEMEYVDKFQDDLTISYASMDSDNTILHCKFKYEIIDIHNLEDYKENSTEFEYKDINIRIKDVDVKRKFNFF